MFKPLPPDPFGPRCFRQHGYDELTGSPVELGIVEPEGPVWLYIQPSQILEPLVELWRRIRLVGEALIAVGRTYFCIGDPKDSGASGCGHCPKRRRHYIFGYPNF